MENVVRVKEHFRRTEEVVPLPPLPVLSIRKLVNEAAAAAGVTKCKQNKGSQEQDQQRNLNITRRII